MSLSRTLLTSTLLTAAAGSAVVAAVVVAPAAGAADAGRPLFASLSGANEVPAGSGDPDGTGTAAVTINSGTGMICFDLALKNIGTPVAGHIHEAPAGKNGPVVVGFFGGQVPAADSGCVTVDRTLAKEIRQSPADYYVNVHTAEFPRGAVRGQLSK